MNLLCALLLCPSHLADDPPRLALDPLLVGEVVEVFAALAGPDNPVWPGWDAGDTPILLYLPHVQDVLIRHPAPPAGFRALETDLVPAGWSVHVRDGDTRIEMDGQNTSIVVEGVQTLVVADSVSNVRNDVAGLLRGSGDVEDKVAELTADLLTTDPYSQLGMVVHEAFHVHQYRNARDKLASESLLLDYPWLSASVNVGWALEGRALADVMHAENPAAVREAAVRWLAVRLARRASLPEGAIAYEDGTEFGEGLAKYAEWKLARVLEGRTPGPGLRWARGFRGYADLGFWRERLVRSLLASTSGEMVVNGDPYGSGNLRFRLYSTGLGIAALLDAVGAQGWQARILEPGTTLTELARAALAASDAELAEGLARARAVPDLAEIERAKADLERRGAAEAQERVARVLEGGALFTLDYSALEEPPLGFGYTPFGLTRVDEDRLLYSMVPVSVDIGGVAQVEELVPSPLLHDRAARTVRFQLRSPVTAAEVSAALGRETLADEVLDIADLTLPGAVLRKARGRVRFDGGGVTVVLARE